MAAVKESELAGLSDWAPSGYAIRMQLMATDDGRAVPAQNHRSSTHHRGRVDTEYIPVWRRPLRNLSSDESPDTREDRTGKLLGRGRATGGLGPRDTPSSRGCTEGGAIGYVGVVDSRPLGYRLALAGSQNVEPGTFSTSGSSELESTTSSGGSRESRKGGARRDDSGGRSASTSKVSRTANSRIQGNRYMAIVEKFNWDGMRQFVKGSMSRGNTLRYWGIWGAEGDGEALGEALEEEATTWPGQRFPWLEHQQEVVMSLGMANAGGASTYSGSAYYSSGAGSTETGTNGP